MGGAEGGAVGGGGAGGGAVGVWVKVTLSHPPPGDEGAQTSETHLSTITAAGVEPAPSLTSSIVTTATVLEPPESGSDLICDQKDDRTQLGQTGS